MSEPKIAPKIIEEHFCGLAGNQQWQTWLYNYDITLYGELVSHLRTSKGCAHNRDKMRELMHRIDAKQGGREALVKFLRSSFPAMLEQPQEVVRSVAVANVPFVIANPNVPTFPKRAILEHPDQVQLHSLVQQLVGGKLKYDYVMVGGRAYVEYVPASHADVLGQIPDKNWLVTAFKRANGF